MKAKTRWRKGVKVAAGAGALALIVSAAVPFVFPTATVRLVMARTGLAELPLTFESARLSPLGTLTVKDVVLADAAAGGKPLMTAKDVQVEFNWLGVGRSRLKAVRVEGAELIVRPGEDAPVTLMRLFGGGESPSTAAATHPGAGSAAGSGEGEPLWIDLLTVRGVVRVEGVRGGEQVLRSLQVQPGTALRLDGRMAMSGDRRSPSRDFAVVLGEVDPAAGTPGVVARGRVREGAVRVLTLETLAVTNVTATAEALAGAPAWLRRAYRGRLNRLQIGGQITFGPETQVALLGELHDLSVQGADVPGMGGLGVEHVSVSTRVVGKWSGAETAWRDLAFAPTHVSWESALVGPVRVTRGVADLQSDGGEIILTDLQASVGDATVSAMGAYDLRRDVLTRGRLWLNGVDLAKATARLPGEWRSALPGNLAGVVNSRVFLRDLDGERVSARVEVSSREEVSLLRAQPGGASPAVKPPGPEAVVTLTNMLVGAEVTWDFGGEGLPEVRGGRLTADRLELLPPRGNSVQSALRVQSDFGLVQGVARLQDLYANFEGGARLSLEGAYDLRGHMLEGAKLSLENVDGQMISAWLPGAWGISGRLDAEVQVGVEVVGEEASVATVEGAVVLSPESSVNYGEAVLGISGAFMTDSPTPMITVQGTAELGGAAPGGIRAVTIDTFTPRGFGAIRLDRASAEKLRDLLKPAAGSFADAVLSRVKKEATASFEDLSVTGKVELEGVPRVSGAVRLSGFSLDAPAPQGDAQGGLAVAEMNVHGTVASPLTAEWLAGLRVTEGTLQVQRISAGQRRVEDLTAAVEAGQGRAAAKNVVFKFAEAGFTGEAGFTLAPVPAIEEVRLTFRRLEQGVVTAALSPEEFSAEGPVSGELVLERKGGALAGQVSFVTDAPGAVRLSRETVDRVLAEQAKAAVQQAGSLIPENFDEILLAQFTHFPYLSGNVQMQDSPQGLKVELNYRRKPLEPGDPGYGVPVTVAGQTVRANFEFVPQFTLTVNESIAGLLGRTLGFQNLVFGGGAATRRGGQE